MKFKEIFERFLEHQAHLKVIFVASADKNGQPNCAPKMLIEVVRPNKIFYLDYKSLRTHENILQNPRASLSIMHDRTFVGFRLNGFCQIVKSGAELKWAKEKWSRRVVAYEASRMVDRMKGIPSSREAEFALPKDFVLVKFIAEEGSMVKPDRVLRAIK